MKHTKEESINALKVIKEECEVTGCDKGPFSRRKPNLIYECVLTHSLPDEWEIAEEEPETWRAFK